MKKIKFLFFIVFSFVLFIFCLNGCNSNGNIKQVYEDLSSNRQYYGFNYTITEACRINDVNVKLPESNNNIVYIYFSSPYDDVNEEVYGAYAGAFGIYAKGDIVRIIVEVLNDNSENIDATLEIKVRPIYATEDKLINYKFRIKKDMW